MYIVYDKESKKEVHRNNAPVSQMLTSAQVYHAFNPDKHVIISTDKSFKNPVLDEKDGTVIIREKTLVEQIQDGEKELPDNLKIVEGELVQKEIFELLEFDDFKKLAIDSLKSMCDNKSNEIFSDKKQLNVLTGATYGYPEYLCGTAGIESLGKFNAMYRNIYHSTLDEIEKCKTNEEIKAVIESTVWPTEEEILIHIQG